MRPLVDAHHIGLKQSGNEVWALNVMRASEELQLAYDYCLSAPGAEVVCDLLDPAQQHIVSSSSWRRLSWDLTREIRRLRPSTLVVHYTRPILCGVPIVVVVHDCSFAQPEARQWLPPGALARYRTSIGATVRTASAFLTPTEYVRQDLIRIYGVEADRVFIAPNAVDPELLAHITKIPPVTRERSILMVGNPLPRKNMRVVVDAVSMLRGRGADVKLRLVGSINERGRAAVDYASSVLGDNFEMAGFVSSEMLAAEYARAGVLAYASLSEGFGIPAIEAMAAELPVVVSDSTALPEVVGSAAQRVSPHDVEGWASALLSALEDPDRWRKAGLERSRSFNWRDSALALFRAIGVASDGS